jgi:hypothetical protein
MPTVDKPDEDKSSVIRSRRIGRNLGAHMESNDPKY